jgi:hypothetical protein
MLRIHRAMAAKQKKKDAFPRRKASLLFLESNYNRSNRKKQYHLKDFSIKLLTENTLLNIMQ